MAIVTAHIVAVFLQVFFFEPTLQETRSANFTLFRGFRCSENQTWMADKMTDIGCATLATMVEAEGFNLRKGGEADVFGRCQLIPKIIEGCATVDEANYLFYSNFGIRLRKNIDHCASNPCTNATRRFIAIPEDTNKYIDCGTPGKPCLILHCTEGMIFDETQNTCIQNCGGVCDGATDRFIATTDTSKYIDCGTPIGSLCIDNICADGLIFYPDRQSCNWP
ncbi:hypothetical protein LSH36_652g01112 [Paralvinella palmiformis]|uniref:Uncharacterized protein n=1 Tax=Paralvinella palmiformis TaxID=53620 RepID=A0AAD9J3S7_9ANNE|nr:hypothetical protein LSH36_652g01112 [Paralvinella palmiformis]